MPKPMAKAGTISKVNLTPFVLAKIVAINQKISKILYFMSISASDFHSAMAMLMAIGMEIRIKNVFRFSTFSKNIIMYQAMLPSKNHSFSRFILVIVMVIPMSAMRKKNSLPKPTWLITLLREAGFCSATVVKTFGHIVVMPTSFSFANPPGFL